MGTRVLNFDDVRPSGELHDIVKELFNIAPYCSLSFMSLALCGRDAR